MPINQTKLPSEGAKIKFRRKGEKILREGKFEDGKFQVCSQFLCVAIDEVDYWREIK